MAIYIKKKNRGKFTRDAKQAGQTVQEHARAVLNNPKATKLQKKRAIFARVLRNGHTKMAELFINLMGIEVLLIMDGFLLKN